MFLCFWRWLSRCTLRVVVLPFVVFPIISGAGWAQEAIPARPLADNKAPSYPEQARKARLTGDVVFRARITDQGQVESVSVSKVPRTGWGFEQAVEEAVADWRFEPARSGDTRIPWTYSSKIGFTLQPGDEKAIRQLLEDAGAAWSNRDGERISSLFVAERGHIHVKDELVIGQPNLENWFGNGFAAKQGDSRLQVSVNAISFLHPDLPTAELSLEITCGDNREGGERPVVNFNGVASLIKSEDHWKLAHLDTAESPGPKWAVEGKIRPPRKTKDVAPLYPNKAKAARFQGVVTSEAVISAAGAVGDVVVLQSMAVSMVPPDHSSYEQFEKDIAQALVDAVGRWRYEPSQLGRVKVPSLMTITASFSVSRNDGHIDVREYVHFVRTVE